MMEVVDVYKSVVIFSIIVYGFEVYLLKFYFGVSVVMMVAELIVEFNCIGDEMMECGDISGCFDLFYMIVYVGMIVGGMVCNILFKFCSFYWEFCGLLSFDLQEILNWLEMFVQEVVFKCFNCFGEFGWIEMKFEVVVLGFVLELGLFVEILSLWFVGKNYIQIVLFGMEVGYYQVVGILMVVCGLGFIDQVY